MFDKRFIDGEIAYRVNIADMPDFLKICERYGMKWVHGMTPTMFNPFKYYEGGKLEFLKPVQKIEDRNFVYIFCYEKVLRFSFDRKLMAYKKW